MLLLLLLLSILILLAHILDFSIFLSNFIFKLKIHILKELFLLHFYSNSGSCQYTVWAFSIKFYNFFHILVQQSPLLYISIKTGPRCIIHKLHLHAFNIIWLNFDRYYFIRVILLRILRVNHMHLPIVIIHFVNNEHWTCACFIHFQLLIKYTISTIYIINIYLQPYLLSEKKIYNSVYTDEYTIKKYTYLRTQIRTLMHASIANIIYHKYIIIQY